MRRRFYTLDVFTDRRSPATRSRSCSTRRARRRAHAGDRARVQPVGDCVRLPSRAIPSTPRRCASSRRRANCRSPAIRRSATAALLAHLRAPRLLAAQDLRVVLEEQIGEVVCVARHRRGEALAAYFTLPRLPRDGGAAPPTRGRRRAPRPCAGGHWLRRACPDLSAPERAYLFAPLA